ncbi:variable surface protein Vir18, putative [Plasmodium vivax]|uniref:Variable surface protein Vir18, putative n=1 Tax=Plasmodium vivax (strain Salvador I) TaxID=126793 RepID=A5KD58_PLAVS|nr:variable surface protein Vir18, putative [Plasmodium vivax]EDL42711.1 variable surface protein Vir18, putative [Plasmodium vivax]|eukprot:XP_001612504.1 variable surface protein Vir18 [Plasmodium vivax Sal-1]
MLGRRNPAHNSAFDIYRRFYSNDCTQKYNKYKNEIEQKISVFKKRKSTNFKEWDTINKFIIDKNNEIKDCVSKKYVSIDYYGDPDIKNFSEICTSDGKCNNGNTQVKKSPATKTGKRETCKRGTNCGNQIPSAGAETITLQRRPPAKNTIRVSSPMPDPKNQVAEVEVPGKSVNLGSSSSEENQAKTQHLIVSKPSQENVLGTAPRDHPVETITNGESGRGNSSEVSDSDKNTLTTKLLDNQSLSDNPLNQQNTVGKLNLCRDCTLQANAQHNVDTAIVVEDVPPQGNTVERDPTDAAANGLVLVDVGPLEQHKDVTTTGIKHLSGGCDNIGVPYAHNEDSPDRTHCNEGTSDQEPHSKTISSKGENIESFNDNSNIIDTLKEFFEVISNKDHIIKASAPMGIVMLLGLLFKFTPLLRVLTKKNRKKGAGIIEELNSVVQEPSIMDDERSIPFSYGAFEYSS